MSSELELTEAGRLRLAFLIAQERAKPIREPVPQIRHDLSYCAAKALANEERRLKLATRPKGAK